MKSFLNFVRTATLLGAVLVISLFTSCGGGGGGKSGPGIVPRPSAPEWISPVGRWEIAGEPGIYLVDKVHRVVLATSIADPVNRGEDEVLIALYGKGAEPSLYPATADLRFIPTGTTLVNEVGQFISEVAGRGTVSFRVEDTAGHVLVVISFTRNFVDGTPSPPLTNHPPVLNPTGPTSLEVGQEGSWAANATDEDGDTLTYKWFVDETLVGTSLYSCAFTLPGTYLVRVEVRDGHGGLAVHEWTVVVTDNQVANQPPVAKLKLIGSSTGQAPFTVQVDASESYDPDGTIVEYYFYFHGGGGSATVLSIPTLTHVYENSGQYSAWVKVVDDDGASSWSATGVDITVTAPTTGQVLVAFPASIVLELGESQEFQLWLKDQQTGSLIRQLNNTTELTGWTIAPAVEGEGYVTATKGTIVTWQDSGPPNYDILTYATPGTYTVTAAYGELNVTVPVTINFASGG